MKIDQEFSSQFTNAKPFPHIVVDDLWDDERLRLIASEFPRVYDPRWTTYPDPNEYGKRAGDQRMWGLITKDWFHEMRSPQTCRNLEKLTGITPLTADDLGGGMHMTSEGGRLAMHADFNVHPYQPQLERRLNVLVFLNEEWRKEWGGTLYLGKDQEVSINPSFNRTVIFACSSVSFHGHPEPIVGNHRRKSLAVYYYAPVREGLNPHSTVWAE